MATPNSSASCLGLDRPWPRRARIRARVGCPTHSARAWVAEAAVGLTAAAPGRRAAGAPRGAGARPRAARPARRWAPRPPRARPRAGASSAGAGASVASGVAGSAGPGGPRAAGAGPSCRCAPRRRRATASGLRPRDLAQRRPEAAADLLLEVGPVAQRAQLLLGEHDQIDVQPARERGEAVQHRLAVGLRGRGGEAPGERVAQPARGGDRLRAVALLLLGIAAAEVALPHVSGDHVVLVALTHQAGGLVVALVDRHAEQHDLDPDLLGL